MVPKPLIWFLIILSTSTMCQWSFIRPAQSATTTGSGSLSDGQSLLRAMVAWKSNFTTWVGDNPCQWGGVHCNNDQRVTYLNLSNKGVQGPIPQEIGNLIFLETLDLNNPRDAKPPLNSVTGDLSALQNLTNLKSLNLSFNDVHLSSFPPVVLSLKELRHLRLDNNYLQGQIPKELAKLKFLEYLYLGNNSMTGPLPNEFSDLVNLIELSLWNNNLNSTIPSEFGNLLKLEYLNLHDCGLYGGIPSELGNLVNLKNLSLYRNYLTGPIPDSLKNLTKLYNLFLHDNSLTKQFPTWTTGSPKLTNLSLGKNYFYGSLPSFEGSNLQFVSISCNFFTEQPPGNSDPPTFNDSGNCFADYDSDAKIQCRQTSYHDCNDFLSQVPNGGCPQCPSLQVLEDSQNCVCTLDQGGCPQCPSGQVLEDSKNCVCTLDQGGGSKVRIIIGSVVGAATFVCLLLALLWWVWARYYKRQAQPFSRYYRRYFETQGAFSDFWEGPEGVVPFKLEDLARVTDNFDEKHEIGIGGFGKVFYANIEGRDVAIKCAHLSSIQSSTGFRNEVLLLSRLHHRNLVHLLGFCEAAGIQILVYEYMPNGNLCTLLFENHVALDWLKRLDIAIGVAHGLEYLHSFADPPVIHRDVKPSNILLDDNMVAKLSDFGLSKIAPETKTHFSTRPAGTVGYIDPQYILKEELTTSSDVYSFGMVLLELISGQKSIDNTRVDGRNLVEWVKLKMGSDGMDIGLTQIVDPRLGDRFPSHIFQDIARVAIDCASFQSEDRPSMKAVVTILDACRWSVSPLLYNVPSNVHEYPQEEQTSEEDFYAEQKGFARRVDPSCTVRSSNTFSVSSLLPR